MLTPSPQDSKKTEATHLHANTGKAFERGTVIPSQAGIDLRCPESTDCQASL